MLQTINHENSHACSTKKEPSTFTLLVILEMEMWDCCNVKNATQLDHVTVTMQKSLSLMTHSCFHASNATQLNDAAVDMQMPHRLMMLSLL